MMAILFKFLFPVVGFYYSIKWLRNFLKSSASSSASEAFQLHSHTRKKYAARENIIEICTKCGEVEHQGHRC